MVAAFVGFRTRFLWSWVDFGGLGCVERKEPLRGILSLCIQGGNSVLLPFKLLFSSLVELSHIWPLLCHSFPSLLPIALVRVLLPSSSFSYSAYVVVLSFKVSFVSLQYSSRNPSLLFGDVL